MRRNLSNRTKSCKFFFYKKRVPTACKKVVGIFVQYLTGGQARCDKEKFNAGTDIKGLYLRFAPSRLNINDLSSKTLKKKAQLKNVKELNPDTPSSNNNG